MKHVISSLAIVTSLLGSGACTMDDESPDVDLATLDLRSDFEVIVVEPTSRRNPHLAETDLRAKASPGDLSFADDRFVGGAGAVRDVPETDGTLTWRGYPVGQRDLPTYEGHELGIDRDLPAYEGHELGIDRDLPAYEGHELGSETDLPQQLDDPCMCTGEACLRDWVDANIGCDVCAVFVCDGSLGPHACNSCN